MLADLIGSIGKSLENRFSVNTEIDGIGKVLGKFEFRPEGYKVVWALGFEIR